MKIKPDIYLKAIFAVLIITFISIAIMATQSSVTLTIGNHEPVMPTSKPTSMFHYKNDTFEHLESGNYRVIYEYVLDGRHIVASGPASKPFVAPLFEDKAEAAVYMQRYFDYRINK